jgi:hypothetical protein
MERLFRNIIDEFERNVLIFPEKVAVDYCFLDDLT